jgi:hypothetical protein
MFLLRTPIVILGNLGFTSASLILGIRLCLLARRTRQLPETMIGISFLFGGFLAFTLQWVAFVVKPPEPYLSITFYTMRGGASIACGLLTVVAWQLFRRDQAWARLVVGFETVTLVVYVFRDNILGRTVTAEVLYHPLHWVFTTALTLPYLWLTFEALHYQADIRRQWMIGLPADLVVATRMRLWALGMGAIGCMLVSLEVFRLYNLVGGHHADPRLMISSMGLICSICLWTSFFLPRGYVRRLEAMAASPPAA